MRDSCEEMHGVYSMSRPPDNKVCTVYKGAHFKTFFGRHLCLRIGAVVIPLDLEECANTALSKYAVHHYKDLQ